MSKRVLTDARRLDQRITIQRKTTTQDPATGDLSFSWADLITCWCAIDSVKLLERHREPVQADKTQIVTDYSVWMRSDIVARFDVTGEDRIVWKGTVLDILDIQDNQIRGRLTLFNVRKGFTDG